MAWVPPHPQPQLQRGLIAAIVIAAGVFGNDGLLAYLRWLKGLIARAVQGEAKRIHLRPPGAVHGDVLLSYLTRPFLTTADDHRHSENWEARQMAIQEQPAGQLAAMCQAIAARHAQDGAADQGQRFRRGCGTDTQFAGSEQRPAVIGDLLEQRTLERPASIAAGQSASRRARASRNGATPSPSVNLP